MKKLGAFSFIVGMLLLLLLPAFPAAAKVSNEQIYSIITEVVLDRDGTASITQTWNTYTDSGTEYYIDMAQTSQMEIQDLTAEGPGGAFETVPRWDEGASFEKKAGKVGILHRPDGGQELCWGKTAHGPNTYVLRWKYLNAVQGYTDYDGFLIRFVNKNMDPAPESAKITFHRADGALERPAIRIWGFGNRGTTVFQNDGTVVADSGGSLSSSSHMTVMMQFDKGMFDPRLTHDQTFVEAVRDEAMKGADFGDKTGESGRTGKSSQSFKSWLSNTSHSFNEFFNSWGVLIAAIFLLAGWLVGKGRGSKGGHSLEKEGHSIEDDNPELAELLNSRTSSRVYPLPNYKIPRKEFEGYGEWSRDIPFDNDLILMYYAEQILDEPRATWDSLMTAYLLRWVKMGAMTPDDNVEQNSGVSRRRASRVPLRLNNPPQDQSWLEKELWRMVEEAAGPNRILEKNELKEYSKKNYTDFTKWAWQAVVQGAAGFEERGGLVKDASSNELSGSREVTLTPAGRAEIADYLRFCQYLKDFTLINERQIQDIETWDDYLIIAALVGLGDAVSKQMESLRPDYRFATSASSRSKWSYGFLSESPSNLCFYLEQFSSASADGCYSGGITLHASNRSFGGGFFSSESFLSSPSSGGGGSSSFGGGGGFSGGGDGGGSR